MIEKCHAVGCNNTMHPTCVHDFEDGINYDEDDGKVEGTYYCPLHHPMKHRLLDDSDDEDIDAKSETAGMKSVQTSMPSLPTVLESAALQCDWRLSTTGIKRFFKLNNNVQQKAKGSADYDPCVKYDYVYKVLVHNMNYVSATADQDATCDESTWGFGGYSGDCGGRLKNKPVSRGKL